MTQKTLIEIINKIEKDFNEFSSREMCGVHYTGYFDDYKDIFVSGTGLFNHKKNDVLIERKKNERHFHNFLLHQMFSRLQEIKYYSRVNISDTRRFVAVSPDCISMIQILVRDEIHLMVHFRSSDFDGALPTDLEFICKLPHELIVHLEKMIGLQGYEEVTLELIEELIKKKIKLDLSFGSIHRTN